MEMGVAPRNRQARSATWNSGMLRIMIMTRSPWPTPRALRPSATRATWSAQSWKVISPHESSSFFQRSATESPRSATVARNRSGTVLPSTRAWISSLVMLLTEGPLVL